MNKTFVVTLAASCLASSAFATFHTWRISQLFSDSTGTIQFVEMHESFGDSGEQFLMNHTLVATSTFTFGHNLPIPSDSTNAHFLVATAGYAALTGSVAPDFILPSHFLALGGGTLTFAEGIDSISYGPLSTNGFTSTYRDGTFGSNFHSDLNIESNYAGDRGSVVAPAPAAAALLPLGLLTVARRRR